MWSHIFRKHFVREEWVDRVQFFNSRELNQAKRKMHLGGHKKKKKQVWEMVKIQRKDTKELPAFQDIKFKGKQHYARPSAYNSTFNAQYFPDQGKYEKYC